MARISPMRALCSLFAGAAACLRLIGLPTGACSSPATIGDFHGLYRVGRHRYVRRAAYALIYRAIVRGLTLLICVGVLFSVPNVSFAATQSEALASCQSEAKGVYVAGWPNGPYTCAIWTDAKNGGSSSSSYGYKVVDTNGNAKGGWYRFDGAPDQSTTCATAIASASIYMSGKVLASSTGCQAGKDSSGASLSCGMTYTPVSPPTVSPYSGSWQTYVTAAPTGNACDATADHSVMDATGATEVPSATADTAIASPTTTPPKVCGGGSCYDPGSDQYCATSGGEQVCVSGATARSAAGGCASGGDGTLCAGQTPPTPSPSKVSDPATQIVASDKTTQADPATGTPVTVTANTYTTTPGSTSSGQKTGDSGPAAASSAGSSDDGSYGGGGDCNTPPTCTGDPSVCGFARQSWALQCQLHKDLTDKTALDGADRSTGPDGDPNTLFSDGGGSSSDVLGTLDAGGFLGGGGACPVPQPIEVDGNVIADFTSLCDPMHLLGLAIIAFAYAYGAFIIGRGRAT